MIAEKFVSNEILKDLELASAPMYALEVAYSDKLKLEFGNVLTPTQVQNPPTSIKWPAEPNALYTLMFTDPDATSRANPTMREFQHWLVYNIPGNQISKGTTLFDHISAGPPPDSGLHRYIFLVYKQPGPIKCEETPCAFNQVEGRPKFSTSAFAKKYNLGNPIAGNFYQAEYDDYVPMMYKKIGLA